MQRTLQKGEPCMTYFMDYEGGLYELTDGACHEFLCQGCPAREQCLERILTWSLSALYRARMAHAALLDSQDSLGHATSDLSKK